MREVEGGRLALSVGPEGAGERLDLYLVRSCPDRSRSALARLVRDGRVTVNGRLPRKAGQPVETNDQIVIELAPPREEAPQPEQLPLRLLYEDEDLLVVDKVAGVAVHPGPGHPGRTLVNALLGRGVPLAAGGAPERPGIVHRLDKETSGLLLVAKTQAAYEALTRQFKERAVEKVYLALVHGLLVPPAGTIEAPIARDPRHRQRMAVVPGGREAATGYRVLARVGSYTLVEAYPRTGRTHQVRVHFASLGHPIAGDAVYGRGRRGPVTRLFLHAHRLRFSHPRTGLAVSFVSPLPEDLVSALGALGGAGAARLLARRASSG